MGLDAVFLIQAMISSGLFLIIALILNFTYGTAKVPFLGIALPVAMGGYTVSAITTRLTFMIVEMAGYRLLPYHTLNGWVYNSQHNVYEVVNPYLATRPFLCVALILFSLIVSMVLGAVVGWLISKPALRYKPEYLIILNLSLLGLGCVLGRNIIEISGGTLGVFIPNLFAFDKGDAQTIYTVFILLIALGVTLFLKTIRETPYGRLLKAASENMLQAETLGKDVVRLKEEVILIGSGMMALVGTLNAFQYCFVIEANFHNFYWGYWPLLMILVGGLGSNRGAVIGVILVQMLRYSYIIFKAELRKILFFPLGYLLNLSLAVLMILFLILRQRETLQVSEFSPKGTHRRNIEG